MAHLGTFHSYSRDAAAVAGASATHPPPLTPKPKTQPKWLDAWSDQVANVDCTSELMTSGDLAGDGEWRLVMADAKNKKLKVWSADRLVGEVKIPDIPVAICSFYALPTDGGKRKPRVAVAAGQCVYIYAGGSSSGDGPPARPFYKFTLPDLPLDPREAEVWARVQQGYMTADDAFQTLSDIRDDNNNSNSVFWGVTERALELLQIEDDGSGSADVTKKRERFLRQFTSPPSRVTSVTCLGSIKQTSDDPDAVSCLFFATESGEVHVLTPDAKQIETSYTLPSPVAFISATGRKNGDHKITCACRDGRVYLIINGELSPHVFDLETQPCGIACVGNDCVVGCADHTVHAYATSNFELGDGRDKKQIFVGQKTYGIYFNAPIKAMKVLDVNRQKRFERLLVGLGNGEIRVYNESKLAVTIHMHQSDPCKGLLFGRLGREENALVVVTNSGATNVKIMPRRADLTGNSAMSNQSGENKTAAETVPLAVPKKTKVYVEHTARERQFGVEMHQAFQKDLCKLRLHTARASVAALRDGSGGMSGGMSNQSGGGVSVRLDASVRGLGPMFKIIITAVNTGQKPIHDAVVMFAANPVTSYAMEHSQISLPALLPGIRCTCEIAVESTDPTAGAGMVQVYVCETQRQSAVPIVSAVVRMPLAEFFD